MQEQVLLHPVPSPGTSWVVAMENAEAREKDQSSERRVLRRLISARMVAAPRRRLRRYRDRLAISIYTKQWLSIDFAISPSKFSSSSSSFLLRFDFNGDEYISYSDLMGM